MARRIPAALSMAFALAWPSIVLADAARTQAIVPLIASLMVPERGDYAYGDWNGLRTMPNSQWAQSPTFLDKPTAENDAMALSGRAVVAARPVLIMATGARAGVFNFLVVDQTPFTNADDIANGLRAGRMTISLARCPIGGGYPDARRWYRIAYPGKKPAFLIVAPVSGNIVGYRLNLGDLAPMSEREATVLSDRCGAATPAGSQPPETAGAAIMRNGTDAVTIMIDALMRPAGQPAAISWAAAPKLVPMLKWEPHPPMKMTMPYAEGGEDKNTMWHGGEVPTPTTTVQMSLSGTPAGITRFYFKNIRNSPLDGVFNALKAKGYAITALRCGKAYTQMSDNWFRITGPGKQPATLHRSQSRSTGEPVMSYILRTDNALSPIEAGQRPAPSGGCPG